MPRDLPSGVTLEQSALRRKQSEASVTLSYLTGKSGSSSRVADPVASGLRLEKIGIVESSNQHADEVSPTNRSSGRSSMNRLFLNHRPCRRFSVHLAGSPNWQGKLYRRRTAQPSRVGSRGSDIRRYGLARWSGYSELAHRGSRSYCAHRSSFCVSVRAADGLDRAEGRNDHRFVVGGQVVYLRHRNCRVGST